MFHIVLFAPQIPPNTGNIIRLSANTGATLHLVEPLGFSLDEKSVRRAGLDYHMLADVHIHKNLDACIAEFDTNKIYAITRYGDFSIFEAQFKQGDAFLFGSETAGLPKSVHTKFDTNKKLYLPMVTGNRSLNLSNAASIVVYEAWRQIGFKNFTEN